MTISAVGGCMDLHHRDEEELPYGHLIVSDAGAEVDWKVTKRMRFVMASVLRTINIVMARKEDDERQRLREDHRALVITLHSRSSDDERVPNSEATGKPFELTSTASPTPKS